MTQYNMRELRGELEWMAYDLGFTRFGVIDPADVETLPDRELEPLDFEAKSVAVLIMPSYLASWGSDQAEASGCYFVFNKAHINIQTWVERVKARGIGAAKLGRARAKAAAARAGMGIVRRNTLFYAPRLGSYCTIQVAALSEPLPPDPPHNRKGDSVFDEDACAGCEQCVAACPTNALDGEGHIDRPMCLRQHMLSGKATPVEMRPLIGRKLVGCEICQWACPMQPEVETRSYAGEDVFRVANLLEPSAVTLGTLARLIGSNYARGARISAQAAIVAGNVGKKDYLPALERLCESSDEVIREHAGWARDRIRYGGTA